MSRITQVSGVLLLLAGVLPVHAQRMSGRLLDLDSNQPIGAGMLTLRTSDGVPLITAVTGRDGGWLLEFPAPGRYRIEAARIGYQPWVAEAIEVKAGDDLKGVFHLRRQPIALAPIEVSVEATQRYLRQTGFYDRQRADFGHFITPEDIERRKASRVTDILLGLPGVSLMSMTTGSVGPRFVQLRGSDLSGGGVCRPRVFVDGLIYARGDSGPRRLRNAAATEQRLDEQLQRLDQGLSLDDIGHASNVVAIEVYRSATQVPVQFGGASVETLCGVIVIWTRMGTARTRR